MKWSNRTHAIVLTLSLIFLLLAGCGSTQAAEVSKGTDRMVYAHVNGSVLPILAADNSSADAFLDLLKAGDVTIGMHDYGNFEKVGPLGITLPRNDEQITTEPGDVILYQGNQVTIYYDMNSWDFTRLGKVQGLSQSELKEILGDGNVTVTFSLSDSSDSAVSSTSKVKAAIKASKTKIKRGKKTVIKITTNSGAKLTVKAKNARAKNKKYVKIKSGKTAKLTFTKKAVKGTYKFTVTSPANRNYKKTSKTVKIVVK